MQRSRAWYAPMSRRRRRSMFRAIRARFRWGRKRSRVRSMREARRRGVDYRADSQRLARALLARTDDRSRDADAGRVAYGPVAASDVADRCSRPDFLDGGDHRLALGLAEEIPYLKRQERLTFARVGITDPFSLDDYLAHGGYRGLDRALALSRRGNRRGSDGLGLRGRGGAGFPAGIKWKTTLDQNAPTEIRRLQCR